MGRKILLYLIMYRKYVRNWWLLKRNRIICPEIAVNSQFMPRNQNVFVKLPKKLKFVGNLLCKIDIFCEITWKKLKFFRNLPWKNRVFLIAWKNRNFSQIFLENRNLWWNGLKIEILRKFVLRNRNFCEITWKNRNVCGIFCDLA